MMRTRITFAAFAPLALAACAGTYTGPVEVTRFVSESPASLGEGTITLVFPDTIENELARDLFADAVAGELSQLGYRVVMDEALADQTAAIRTSRSQIDGPRDRRGPVSVGVGGGGGGFGGGTFGGVGAGVGINLGGDRRPDAVTELSVRITGAGGKTLWEGRASQEVSVKSDYADVDTSARALASALFRDFPGGNGESVTIDVTDLQEE